ncbi:MULTISPECIES: ABC transporter substrate-binding protein [Erysipelothrix]|uniref:ABC transporter substrate-binding protein n=1 Tax=Erysipelothrix TaxID=1647 RepID=UPI001376E70C|nr:MULTISPECIES: ABC transporter substrate-binding protein [unclassified Erysipelothrix]MBK2402567.1 extracellular solute-binding protein [Erysipelothrix sp. strain 2 (EsS2-6-Brazil)]MBK2403449.1 extracellular solute-binding protein [Erysipelothrix sp. strain 2 (EsS2-7-Brazil)]NBA01495.1 extracellular solute-binding protein [Erysipelothrix rhusiopathiae]
MKKGVFKTFTVLMAALLVLTGCGKKTDKPEGEVVTLQLYQVGDAPKNLDELTDAINKISEEEIGVKVKFNYIGWGDYEQKMSVMVTAGDEFDLAFANNYTINAQKGAYADLTDLVKEHAKEFFDSVDPIYYDGNVIDGKLYGFPINGNVFAQQMLTFNSDYLNKYNIDVSNINSYADAEAALQTVKDNEPEVAPFAIGSGYKATLGNFDYILGDKLPFAINLDGDTTKIVNAYETSQGMETLKQIHGLYKKGLIPQDAATSTTGYALESPVWFMRQETQGPADYGDSLLSQVAGKEIISRPLNKPLKSTAQAQMGNFIVAINSKHKVEAVKWLNLLNTNAQMMNTLIYGIEGEAWKKIDDNHLELLDGYKEDNHMAAWNTGNSALLLQQAKITDEMIAKRAEDTKNAPVSPILGFNFKTDEVKTEISALMNVMEEYSAVINTGTVDPEVKVPEFVEKLKAAGWDKVLDEMQSQYDAFQASK